MNRNGLTDRNITPVPIHLGIGNSQEGTQFAFYNDNYRKFVYNLDFRGLHTKPFFLNAAEHELLHAQQYKEIALLKAGKLSGERAQKAKQYDYEFNNYVDFVQAENAYKKQIVENEALTKGWDAQYSYVDMTKQIIEKFKKSILVESQMLGTFV